MTKVRQERRHTTEKIMHIFNMPAQDRWRRLMIHPPSSVPPPPAGTTTNPVKWMQVSERKVSLDRWVTEAMEQFAENVNAI